MENIVEALGLFLNYQNFLVIFLGVIIGTIIGLLGGTGLLFAAVSLGGSIGLFIIQERMAGNTIDRQLAFQAAEAALRDGERFIANTTLKLDEIVFDFTTTPESPLNYD